MEQNERVGPKEVNGVDSGGESCWRRQAGWVPLVAAETRKRPAWSVADEENTRSERMRARKRTTGRERESTERGEFERRYIWGKLKQGRGKKIAFHVGSKSWATVDSQCMSS